nr:unnamed protein product [Digitaria exilis]
MLPLRSCFCWPCNYVSEALPPVGDPADTTCPAEQPSPAVAPMPSNHSEPGCQPPPPRIPVAVFPYDVDPMRRVLPARGVREGTRPDRAEHVPPPIGARKANLDDLTWRIVAEFALQEVGHIRAIQDTVGGFPRPSIDLSAHNFARVMDLAFGSPLNPPFDPYINSLNFLLASYFIPYLGINGYVGTNPIIDGYKTKMLVAGLLGVEAGQDAVIRALLFERRGLVVAPYNVTVAEFTDRVSALRNKLGQCGVKDEGLTPGRPPSCSRSSTSPATSACPAGSSRRAPTGGSPGRFLANQILAPTRCLETS